MGTRHLALGALLGLAAGPLLAAPYEGYDEFYAGLGRNLFPGEGLELQQACTDEPRHCLWTNALGVAAERYPDALWSAPGELGSEAPAGWPALVFDGSSLAVAGRTLSLADAVNLAPADWGGTSPQDPESLASVTAWQQGTDLCLELHYNGSGRMARYSGVLVVRGGSLHVLPPLFAACGAVREGGNGVFFYPDTRYLKGPGDLPPGVQMDYRRSDGAASAETYRLRFSEPDNPYRFVIEPAPR